MTEKKIQARAPGMEELVDAFEVAVAESTERWSEVKLEDGSVLRLKPVVLSAIRLAEKYDQDGNPIYSVKVNQVMAVASAPEHLRKGATTTATDTTKH